MAPPPWEGEAIPAFEDPYEVSPAPSDLPAVSPVATDDLVGRLKESLMAKKKMMLMSAINKADSIGIEGDSLRIAFAADNAGFKNQVDTRDNRKLIEEICRDLAGRRITLAITVGDQAAGGESGAEAVRDRQIDSAKYLAENHPKLRALTQKFQGQVIEIIKPEAGE